MSPNTDTNIIGTPVASGSIKMEPEGCKVSAVKADGPHLSAVNSSRVRLMFLGCARRATLALRLCWSGWHSGTSRDCEKPTPLLFPTLWCRTGASNPMQKAVPCVPLKRPA